MNVTTVESSSDMVSANELASWNRQRTTEELRGFVSAHHALIPDSIDIE